MNTATAYAEFIERKSQLTGDGGFEPLWIPDFLYDFQKALVEWSIRKGNSAIFADCGLGKTPIQLVWSENVIRKTNGKVLIIAPLAVSAQTVREAEKFGIDCRASKDGTVHPNITVTNYERLHYFDPDAFSGVVCDESSAIKQFGGKRRKQVIQFMHKTPYRLLCTATAAPNDYIELGTHSEALGIMGQVDMLSTFFRSPDNANYLSCKAGDFWNKQKWMFKAHAELEFWRWVCSWARALRRPSDLGFNDSRFVLPPLEVEQTVVKCNRLLPGELFPVVAKSLKEQRAERRLTINERCEMTRKKVMEHDRSIIWCHINDEGDALEKIIPNAIQIAGKDSDEYKEAAIEWFCGYKCICNNELFCDKLAAWKTKKQDTGKDTTQSIESNGLQNRAHINKSIENAGRDICSPGYSGIENTSESTDGKQPSPEMRDGENYTRGMNGEGSKRANKPKNGRQETQTRDSRKDSKNMGSPQRYTSQSMKSKKDCVLSAGKSPSDSTLTIATPRGISEDYSAKTAIMDSGSSATTQKESTAPQCICGHASGIRRLISKPRIAGFGLNLQHCNHMTFFPSHSFEQYYQGVRRCWRFGQKHPVHVDVITTEGEAGVTANLHRKAEAADKMFQRLVDEMNNATRKNIVTVFGNKMEVPSWL